MRKDAMLLSAPLRRRRSVLSWIAVAVLAAFAYRCGREIQQAKGWEESLKEYHAVYTVSRLVHLSGLGNAGDQEGTQRDASTTKGHPSGAVAVDSPEDLVLKFLLRTRSEGGTSDLSLHTWTTAPHIGGGGVVVAQTPTLRDRLNHSLHAMNVSHAVESVDVVQDAQWTSAVEAELCRHPQRILEATHWIVVEDSTLPSVHGIADFLHDQAATSSSQPFVLFGPSNKRTLMKQSLDVPVVILTRRALQLYCQRPALVPCTSDTVLTACLPSLGISVLSHQGILAIDPKSLSGSRKRLLTAVKSTLVSNVLAVVGIPPFDWPYYDYFLNHFELIPAPEHTEYD